MDKKYLDAVIVGRRDLTDRIAEFTIGASDGSALQPGEAGSHIELRFGGQSGRFLRHYSLVGPLKRGRAPEPFWRIAVQREDRARGSAHIHSTFRVGTRLQISRPISAFRLAQDLPHTLLVAGGIGITPVIAMMRSLVLRGQPFKMFYAGANKAAMAYVGEVTQIGGDAVTLHESDADGTPDIPALIAAQPTGTVVHACGPGPMLDALRYAARDAGWAPDRVRHEVFNAAHKPDDVGINVELNDGRVIRVGAGTTILDALEGAGVDTLSDCRRGECGLCLTDVISGDAEIDHRDRFFTQEEKAAGKQICICCSRISNDAKLKLDIE
ncbi:MAG: PDR/VanB family oxidoreductase [Octadecabacter sp.]